MSHFFCIISATPMVKSNLLVHNKLELSIKIRFSLPSMKHQANKLLYRAVRLRPPQRDTIWIHTQPVFHVEWFHIYQLPYMCLSWSVGRGACCVFFFLSVAASCVLGFFSQHPSSSASPVVYWQGKTTVAATVANPGTFKLLLCA